MKPCIEMHCHTFISACSHDETGTGEAFVNKAAEVGIQVLGITDHCWDPTMPGASGWYAPQTIEHVLKIKEQLPEDTKGVKVLIGIESEYAATTDSLGISAEGAKNFDYVLIPHAHTHQVGFVMPQTPAYIDALDIMQRRLREAFPEVSDRQIEKWMMMARTPDVKLMRDIPIQHEFVSNFMVDSFIATLENEEFKKLAKTVPTFIAHPFVACGYSRADRDIMVKMIPDEKFKEMFTKMAEMGVGYDISVHNFDINNPDTCQMFRIARIAKACGVKFLFGTDTHDVAGLAHATRSTKIFELMEMTKEDLHPFYREFVK